MKTIGVGLIGWGFMGKTHAHALQSIPLFYPGADFRVRRVCVCSRRAEMAKQAAQDAGFERWTDDYRTLLTDPEIDAVSVCTPNALHEEMVVALLKAGKHVYVDKPLAVTAESADRIAAAARESKAFTRMVFNNRYFPSTLRAKALVDEGRIGEILSFQARYLHSGSIDPDKPIGWKQGAQGGVLLDLGSHTLDLLTDWAGWPTRVFCASRRLYDERPTKDSGRERNLSEDHLLATMQLENGALGTLEASKIASGADDELTIELRGTKGALRWNAMEPNYVYFYDRTKPECALGGDRGWTQIESVARYAAPGGTFLPPKNAIGWDRGHIHCYYTFLDAIAHDRDPGDGVADGARLQRLMEALKRSDELERWVEV